MGMPRVWLVWPGAGRFCLFLMGLLPVEEVDGDRGCYGEVVALAVSEFSDWCGFDSVEVVQ